MLVGLSNAGEQNWSATAAQSSGGNETECGDVGSDCAKDRVVQSYSSMVGQNVAAQSGTNLEADFDTEPLKSVDTKHFLNYTADVQQKLKQALWEIRDTLSNGELNMDGDFKVPHSTICDITTTVENPNIVSSNRSADPEARKTFAELTAKSLKQGIIEPSKAPWSSYA